MEDDRNEQIDHIPDYEMQDHEPKTDKSEAYICNQKEGDTEINHGDTNEVKERNEEMSETTDQEPEKVVYCSSCDRCRARKTKCDGNRPCASCVSIYLKHQKVNISPEDITAEMCGCIYRHAKRRGPIPGTSRGKYVERPYKRSNWLDKDPLQAQIETLQGKIQNQVMRQQQNLGVNVPSYSHETIDSLQQQICVLQQQQHQQAANMMALGNHPMPRLPQAPTLSSLLGLPKGVKKNLHLLDRNSVDGARLKSCYTLSVDQLFLLPATPSDEEFFSRNASMGTEIIAAPNYQSILNAARFAELAIGALASDNLLLALELSNATVTCLRDCLDCVMPNMSALFLIAKSFFLHGLFRSFRGDISRYLKYRRVCLNLIRKITNTAGLPALISAISFHDSLAYMLLNASEDDLPDVDDMIPPVTPDFSLGERKSGGDETSSDILLDIDSLASDPNNQLWVQGLPSIFTNSEAPILNRCLDALACAIRTCCDQGNENSCRLTTDTAVSSVATPTFIAASANQDEVCSRTLVQSGYKLLQCHLSSAGSSDRNLGFRLLYLIMSSFMEMGMDGYTSGIGDIQIQNIINACKIVIENPLLLFQGGPTYHMVSNAAVMLCHYMNGVHARLKDSSINIDSGLFDEVLDTFLAVRTLLVTHRKKIPQILRCHGIPRPSTLQLIKDNSNNHNERPFIDLGETFMCRCRGCQGFVLFGCSPCVAAERALAAQKLLNDNLGPFYGGDMNEFDSELQEIGSEFNLDDDILLSILGKIISS